MSRDALLNNLQATGVVTVPAFSLSNSGSRPIPPIGSLMYNTDNNSLYVSQGFVTGWQPVNSITFTDQAIDITNATPSTNCNTGALIVAGGVGIGGDVNICGTLSVAQGTTFAAQVSMESNAQSTSTTTGTLVIVGGLGVGLAVNVGGNLTTTSTTASTTPSSGALVVTGGLGVGGAVNLGSNLTISSPGKLYLPGPGAGSIPSVGSSTLVAGTVTVTTASVTANSIIQLTRQTAGSSTALGELSVGTITSGTSFVINSLQPSTPGSVEPGDLSVVGWLVIN